MNLFLRSTIEFSIYTLKLIMIMIMIYQANFLTLLVGILSKPRPSECHFNSNFMFKFHQMFIFHMLSSLLLYRKSFFRNDYKSFIWDWLEETVRTFTDTPIRSNKLLQLLIYEKTVHHSERLINNFHNLSKCFHVHWT